MSHAESAPSPYSHSCFCLCCFKGHLIEVIYDFRFQLPHRKWKHFLSSVAGRAKFLMFFALKTSMEKCLCWSTTSMRHPDISSFIFGACEKNLVTINPRAVKVAAVWPPHRTMSYLVEWLMTLLSAWIKRLQMITFKLSANIDFISTDFEKLPRAWQKIDIMNCFTVGDSKAFVHKSELLN